MIKKLQAKGNSGKEESFQRVMFGRPCGEAVGIALREVFGNGYEHVAFCLRLEAEARREGRDTGRYSEKCFHIERIFIANIAPRCYLCGGTFRSDEDNAANRREDRCQVGQGGPGPVCVQARALRSFPAPGDPGTEERFRPWPGAGQGQGRGPHPQGPQAVGRGRAARRGRAGIPFAGVRYMAGGEDFQRLEGSSSFKSNPVV